MRALSYDQILEKIGQGGMGEVYRARDTKLLEIYENFILTPKVCSFIGKIARNEYQVPIPDERV